MRHLAIRSAIVAAIGLASAQAAFAGAVLVSGNLALGVEREGHLNTGDGNVAFNSSRTGIALNFVGASGLHFYDATSPGCFCEGWGVSASGVSGYANVSTDGGATNLTVDSFASVPGTSITSNVHLTSLPGLAVSQVYTVSTSGGSFMDTVTITNSGAAALADLRYVRVMDWDIHPTEFAELVSIAGTASTTDLERSHDNGFNTANPLGGDGPILGATTDVDFSDSGPADHGAYFRFNFGALAAGASRTFEIFYGAATSEAGVLAEIAAQGIELYSTATCNLTSCSATGSPATYFFGFRGVGGVPVIPTTPVPEPGSLALFGLGGLLLALRRRRRAKVSERNSFALLKRSLLRYPLPAHGRQGVFLLGRPRMNARSLLAAVAAAWIAATSPFAHAVPISVLPEAAPSSGGPAAAREYGRGLEALTRNDLDAADRAFAAAVAADRRFVPGVLGRAEVAGRRNEIDRAGELLAEAARLAPADAHVQASLGRYYAVQRDYAKAEAALTLAYRADPQLMAARMDLADLYATALRKPEQAIALYRETIELVPQHAGAHYALGVVLADRDSDESARMLAKSGGARPDEPSAGDGIGPFEPAPQRCATSTAVGRRGAANRSELPGRGPRTNRRVVRGG